MLNSISGFKNPNQPNFKGRISQHYSSYNQIIKEEYSRDIDEKAIKVIKSELKKIKEDRTYGRQSDNGIPWVHFNYPARVIGIGGLYLKSFDNGIEVIKYEDSRSGKDVRLNLSLNNVDEKLHSDLLECINTFNDLIDKSDEDKSLWDKTLKQAIPAIKDFKDTINNWKTIKSGH